MNFQDQNKVDVVTTGEKWTDGQRESWTIQQKITMPIDGPAEGILEIDCQQLECKTSGKT